MNEKPLPPYVACLADFEKTLEHCIDVSRRCAGIKSPTSAHFYASALFTRICTTSVSLAILLPRSTWSKKRVDQWDHSTVATVTRAILECCLLFHYLCFDKVDEDEWKCRWNLLNLHDCWSRKKLFEDMGDAQEQAGFELQLEELRLRLRGSKFFQSHSTGQQRDFLRGDRPYFISLESLAEKKGLKKEEFKYVFRLLSSHAHSFPLSFYRMADQERGRGVHSKVEESYTTLFVSWAKEFLAEAADEMETMFEGTSRRE